MARTTATEDVIITDEAAVPEGSDVSLRAYLDADDTTTLKGKVRTRHGDVPIMGLLSEEVEQLQKLATKPDRFNRGQVTLDDTLFKNLLAARGLHKATPEIPEHEILQILKRKVGGDPAIFANAVIKLSGFSEERVAELDRLVGFTG